jgi:hypothetical protein
MSTRVVGARRAVLGMALLWGAAACDGGSAAPGAADAPADSAATATAPAGEAEPPAPPLVDTAIAPAVAGEDGWNYAQEVEFDLDSDGEAERLVLTARVELYRGRPAWDDGQPWQVYVEEGDGRRTYLYSRFVQLGTVAMRVAREQAGLAAAVILVEHLPDRLAVHEIQYDGPNDVTARIGFQRALDPTGEISGPTLP